MHVYNGLELFTAFGRLELEAGAEML